MKGIISPAVGHELLHTHIPSEMDRMLLGCLISSSTLLCVPNAESALKRRRAVEVPVDSQPLLTTTLDAFSGARNAILYSNHCQD